MGSLFPVDSDLIGPEYVDPGIGIIQVSASDSICSQKRKALPYSFCQLGNCIVELYTIITLGQYNIKQ